MEARISRVGVSQTRRDYGKSNLAFRAPEANATPVVTG